MTSTNISRAGAAILLAGLLLGGVLLGKVIDAVMESSSRASAASPSVSAAPSSRATLPAVDLIGEDFMSLPRYPGSVRSGYQVIGDNGYQLIAAEYLAAATVAEVRTFYQGVIAEHGWERVDINYSDGKWAYLLVSGADEALIEIEERDGLVEIDLQLSRPIGQQPPALPDALAPTPAPPAAPPPAAPMPQPPAGGGDDDDSDDTDDDDSDD